MPDAAWPGGNSRRSMPTDTMTGECLFQFTAAISNKQEAQMTLFLRRHLSLVSVMATAAFAGCSQIWILPPPVDGSYRQTIEVDSARPSSPASNHFVDRNDLFRGTPDSPAQIRIRRMPNIPARLGPLHAELLVWAVVEIDGTVRDVVVGKSSGNPEVDALYVMALRNWTFSPAQAGGHAVAQQVGQTFLLRLE